MKKSINIQSKFMLLLLIILVTVFSVNAYIIVHKEYENGKQDAITRAKAFAVLSVNHVIKNYNLYYDSGFYKFREVLGNIMALHTDLERVQILDLHGRIVCDSKELELGKYDQANGDRFISDKEVLIKIKKLDPSFAEKEQGSRRILDIIQPYIEDWGRHDYSVRYTVSFNSLEQRMQTIITDASIMAVVFLLLSMGLIFFFSNFFITRHLGRLMEGVKMLGSGHLGFKVDVLSNDEIGELSNAFNQMSNDLQKTTVSVESLQEEQRRFQDVAESSGDWIWEIDAQGKYTYSNTMVEQILGFKNTEIIGKHFNEYFCSGDLSSVKEVAYEKFIKRKEYKNFKHSVKTKEGQLVILETSGVPILGKDGNFLGYRGVNRDITTRQRAEESIRENEEKFRILFEAANDAIFIIKKDRFIDCNSKTLQMFGCTRDQILGETPYRFSPSSQPNGSDSTEMYMEKINLAFSGIPQFFEWRYIQYDGSVFDAEVSLNSIVLKEEQYLQAIVRDITERKKIEAQLRKANYDLAKNEKVLRRMLHETQRMHEELKNTQDQLLQADKLAAIGQLAAGVAHEINNPIGFISSNLESLGEYMETYSSLLDMFDTLKQKVTSSNIEEALSLVSKLNAYEEKIDFKFISDDVHNLLKECKEGLDRVKKIVMDLRTFAREDKDVMEETDIENVIEGVLGIVWNELKYKAEVKKDYVKVPKIRCNPQRLGQVFINLLINASHAIDDKGEIGIKVYSDEKHVYIKISDTGKGMPKDDMSKIFNPFFTTKPVGKGTGLGLSIVYDVIKQHGGNIEVNSVQGEGSIFTIQLPIA